MFFHKEYWCVKLVVKLNLCGHHNVVPVGVGYYALVVKLLTGLRKAAAGDYMCIASDICNTWSAKQCVPS